MDTPTWPALIRALISGQALSADQTSWAMNEIMDGAASPAQIAGFGVALRAKGETAEEMSGLAAAMLEHATPITIAGPVTDLVGTGGDGAHTVNVSTMATIVAAAAGAPIVKHGNRAASSACGAADVLEALGVVIDLPPNATEVLFAEIGVAFLFAPLYHPAFRHTAGPRRELGVPTAFNYLGPLTNPARPSSLAVGVADPRMGGVLAGVLAARGNSAIVFHGGVELGLRHGTVGDNPHRGRAGRGELVQSPAMEDDRRVAARGEHAGQHAAHPRVGDAHCQ